MSRSIIRSTNAATSSAMARISCSRCGAGQAPARSIMSSAHTCCTDFHRQALAALTALHARDGVLPSFVHVPGHNHLSEIASLGIDDTLAAPLLQFVRRYT